MHSIVPVSAVEIEYSPWSLDIESNGILATCEEFQIPIVAYSPLGRGMLTGTIKKFEDLPENDMRRHFDRFQPENFANNYKIVRLPFIPQSSPQLTCESRSKSCQRLPRGRVALLHN